jgi:hypothetical protein
MGLRRLRGKNERGFFPLGAIQRIQRRHHITHEKGKALSIRLGWEGGGMINIMTQGDSAVPRLYWQGLRAPKAATEMELPEGLLPGLYFLETIEKVVSFQARILVP